MLTYIVVRQRGAYKQNDPIPSEAQMYNVIIIKLL